MTNAVFHKSSPSLCGKDFCKLPIFNLLNLAQFFRARICKWKAKKSCLPKICTKMNYWPLLESKLAKSHQNGITLMYTLQFFLIYLFSSRKKTRSIKIVNSFFYMVKPSSIVMLLNVNGSGFFCALVQEVALLLLILVVR